MKASELIERLQALVNERGDLEVDTWCSECYLYGDVEDLHIEHIGDPGILTVIISL